MLENTQDFIKATVAILGIFHVINIYRQAKREHPVFHYSQHSIANEKDWRWRKPNAELNLTLEDDEQKSCLQIPLRLLPLEKGCIIAGYLSSAFTVYLYSLLFLRDAGAPEYLLGGIFIILSLALINVGSRVSSISLYPDHLVLVENYGFILKRMVIYQHQAKLKFSGKLQSVFELTLDHTEPDFYLYIKHRWCFIFSSQRRFILSVNQSQGSWLVEGLECWKNHAGLQKTEVSLKAK